MNRTWVPKKMPALTVTYQTMAHIFHFFGLALNCYTLIISYDLLK